MTPYDLSKGRITFRQKVAGLPAQPPARKPPIPSPVSRPCRASSKWVQPGKFHFYASLYRYSRRSDGNPISLPPCCRSRHLLFCCRSRASAIFWRTYAVGRRREEPGADMLARQDRRPAPASRTGGRDQALCPACQTGASEATPQPQSVSGRKRRFPCRPL